MIQSIYTSVSNADIKSCGKKGQAISSEPIPLLRNNYLGEYRTELEKSKVRKNLGIADDQSLQWGNLSGFVEDQKDLINYVENKWKYSSELSEDIINVKTALDYVIEFVSKYKTNDEAVTELQQIVSTINTQLSELEKIVQKNTTDIDQIENNISEINQVINKLNNDLSAIDVDQSIYNWITSRSSNSIHLENDELKVKISNSEKNAISVDGQGLYVADLSEEVTTSTQNIETLRTDVNEILNSYITKDELGGDDFNFVNEDIFNSYVARTDDSIKTLNQELDKTVKTGEDGHVNTLHVNKISNDEGNIKITNSFEVEAGVPLDIRTVVKSSEELYKLSPNTAYVGMTVANIADGNIYMLIDKANINNKSGWRASYESIQIKACTAEEYTQWLKNTEISGEVFSPIDETLPFIYSNTYYYIYEDSGVIGENGEIIKDSQDYYITRKWIEGALATKAGVGVTDSLKSDLEKLTETVNEDINSLNNYSTKESIEENYYNKDYINSNYYIKDEIYTKDEVNNNFVTKESLRGDSLEGEDDFVFVTQNQYNEDKETLKSTLDETVKTDSDASLSSLTVSEIKSDSVIKLQAEDVLIGNDSIVTESELTKHIALTEEEYNNIEEKDPDTYYYVYDDNTKDGWVLKSTLNAYYTKEEVINLIKTLCETNNLTIPDDI